MCSPNILSIQERRNSLFYLIDRLSLQCGLYKVRTLCDRKVMAKRETWKRFGGIYIQSFVNMFPLFFLSFLFFKNIRRPLDKISFACVSLYTFFFSFLFSFFFSLLLSLSYYSYLPKLLPTTNIA